MNSPSTICAAFVTTLFGATLPLTAAAHDIPQPRASAVLQQIGLSAETETLLAQTWNLKNKVAIQIDGDKRVIRSNGIPVHATGRFPNRANPNAIREQRHVYRVDLRPQKIGAIEQLEFGPFGVAVNGVPFDPGTAEFWNNDRRSGWRYDALGGAINLGLDRNNAHVQPNGAYHYHGLPSGLIESWSRDVHSALVGYAADGFPIYAMYGYSDRKDARSAVVALRSSYTLKAGQRNGGPGGAYDGTFVADFTFADGLGDLDACNGRDTVTPDYPEGIYAYFLTDAFPFVPRCFRGKPDSSFARRGGGGPPGGGRPGAGPGEDPLGLGPGGRPPRRPPR